MGNERPRYWFPLALLGFAQLAVAAFSGGSAGFAHPPEQVYGTGGMYGTALEMSSAYRTSLDISFSGPGRNDGWLGVALVVYLGTVVFYAVRARRAGDGPRWWKVLAIALGGLAGIVLADLVGYWELDMAGDTRTAVLLTLGLVLLA